MRQLICEAGNKRVIYEAGYALEMCSCFSALCSLSSFLSTVCLLRFSVYLSVRSSVTYLRLTVCYEIMVIMTL